MIILTMILFLNLVMFLFRKKLNIEYSYNKLNCGIFGFSLKKGASHRLAMQKLKILGLYNIERGRDSSGLAIDGELIKGVGLISEFDDFLTKNESIPTPKVNGVVIGHVRQGSFGYKKTIEEAHPFLINEDLIFSHNGTIKNVKELCGKYHLIESDYSVDSKVLGTILDENGFKVLEDYTGYAALAFTYKSKPNVLYLYHGKSREYKHGQVMEERPLWCLETKDGIYYSSLEKSLKAIRESDKEVPFNLKYNTVFTIEEGKFINSEEIKREEKNVVVYSAPVVVTNTPKTREATKNYTGSHTTKMVDTDRMAGRGSNLNSVATIADMYSNLLLRETLPLKVFEEKEKTGFIYYHMGRYWEAPRTLITSPIYVKKGGYIGTYDDEESKLRFFYRGVMLKDATCYKTIKAMELELGDNWVKSPSQRNFALFVSSFSVHPVTNLEIEGIMCSDASRKCWYFNGADCKSEKFTPDFAQRNYQIVKGYLRKIKSFQREMILYNTNELVKQEIAALISGNLIKRTPGGSSQSFLFQNQGEITTESFLQENEDDNDELKFFFDIPFTTYQKGMAEVGEEEIESLRLFSRITFKAGYGIIPTVEEIDQCVSHIFKAAETEKKSIMQVLFNDHERLVLEDCYNKVLDEKSRKRSVAKSLMQSKINLETIIEENEITPEDMNIEDSIENIINSLEDIQGASADLMDADKADNEYVQEVLKTILINIPTVLSNLKEVFGKYDKTLLSARINKIIDTQLMQ